MDNNENNTNNISMPKKVLGYVYDFIFGLPFTNYNKYYKTGYIQSLTKEEKLRMMINDQKHKQNVDFFTRLIMIRPQILNDEDCTYLEKETKQIQFYRKVLIVGLFINWFGYTFLYLVKKKNYLKSLVVGNFIMFYALYATNTYMGNIYTSLYKKYRTVIKDEELANIFRKVYNID
jgi:hypothetical protein